MRIYQLTDRDFEDFYALMEKVEIESKAKNGDGPALPSDPNHFCLDELRRQYRYYFISWRNRMMDGDTYFRGPEPLRDDTVACIRREAERLTRLLPKDGM